MVSFAIAGVQMHVSADQENISATARKLDLRIRPPVYSLAYAQGFGTLYTAVYHPAAAQVDDLWPTSTWRQSIAAFEEGERAITFPGVPDVSATTRPPG
jgi:hypothetical protein